MLQCCTLSTDWLCEVVDQLLCTGSFDLILVPVTTVCDFVRLVLHFKVITLQQEIVRYDLIRLQKMFLSLSSFVTTPILDEHSCSLSSLNFDILPKRFVGHFKDSLKYI